MWEFHCVFVTYFCRQSLRLPHLSVCSVCLLCLRVWLAVKRIKWRKWPHIPNFIKDILRNGSQWLSAMELLVIKLGGSQNVPLVGPFEHRMTISRGANETEKEGLWEGQVSSFSLESIALSKTALISLLIFHIYTSAQVRQTTINCIGGVSGGWARTGVGGVSHQCASLFKEPSSNVGYLACRYR